MDLSVVNHQDYFAQIGDDHKFPIDKFGELANYLIKKKIVKEFHKPYPCSNETLMRAHSKNYIEDVKNIPDRVPLIQIDYETKTTYYSDPTLQTIDSLYSLKNLIRFLTSVLTPSWTDFGANLAPTWPPKSTQTRSKSHPKSIQNRILFLIPFWTDFWWILAPTWTPKPPPNPSKNQSKKFPTS